MSAYDTGVPLYLEGITAAATASYMGAPNMVYTHACRTVALLGGFNLSSPSDIDKLAQIWDPELKNILVEIQGQIKKSGTTVTTEEWKNMGRTEYDAANGKVVEGLDSVIKLTTSQRETLAGIARLSFGMAVFCAATGSVLLAISFAKRAAWVTPVSGAAAEGTATAAGEAAKSAVRKGVWNSAKAWGVAAIISGLISTQLRSATGNFPKTAPDTSNAPQFEQIKIDGLAQADPPKTSGMSGGMPTMPSILG
ncbi:hypothetical protein [Streptosporangium sp. NPDC087985]|uniref:hypothetical protein n=1 Tax=Streptosporangium sp. NPDC087985 TaxID=3366196 RepID=UPI0037FC4985